LHPRLHELAKYSAESRGVSLSDRIAQALAADLKWKAPKEK
jgi:predicted HicB family RNase H-like nuclease